MAALTKTFKVEFSSNGEGFRSCSKPNKTLFVSTPQSADLFFEGKYVNPLPEIDDTSEGDKFSDVKIIPIDLDGKSRGQCENELRAYLDSKSEPGSVIKYPSPGDAVVYDGVKCLFIADHPHHPIAVIELPDHSITTALHSELKL